MQQGHPMTSTPFRDTADDGRFWYWRGASGRRYIHSVYPADACPPLPGAIYVAVKRRGAERMALAAGRFAVVWGVTAGDRIAEAMERMGADEVHVHLLAGSEDRARAILRDIEMALAVSAERPAPAFYPVGLAA
jgi:hypothetical protein